jgi:4-hydroxybenzoate polyprenyltransferase
MHAALHSTAHTVCTQQTHQHLHTLLPLLTHLQLYTPHTGQSILQMFFQAKYLIPDPIANDVKYQASAQPFLVFGLLTTALAIGHVNQLAG